MGGRKEEKEGRVGAKLPSGEQGLKGGGVRMPPFRRLFLRLSTAERASDESRYYIIIIPSRTTAASSIRANVTDGWLSKHDGGGGDKRREEAPVVRVAQAGENAT